jgi:sarcosine oxidase subunit gamma
MSTQTPARDGLTLIDFSVLPRWGLKGREVFPWLSAIGAKVPATDHRAERQRDGALIARLSPAEALILASPNNYESELAPAIERIPASGQGACYPIGRRDSHCWFAISGEPAPLVLAKLCAINLASNRFGDGQIAQTIIAHLSAVLIRRDLAGSLSYSLLVDSASSEYLWDCLLDAMAEFDGVICGSQDITTAPDQKS